MHDVGILVWVLLLIVGVAGSIVSSIRKQAQRAGARRSGMTPPPWVQRSVQIEPPKPAPPRPLPSPPKPAAKATVPLAAAQPFPTSRHPRTAKRFLDNRGDLVRAVIAAEVLGKPRGLADEYPYR